MKMTSRKIGKELGITQLGSDFSRSGFSLIEVMISLIILSVGLLAVAQMQVAAIRGIAFSRHMTSATYLARQQMEYLRALPYDDSSINVIPFGEGGNGITAKGSGVSVFRDNKNGTLPNGSLCGDAQWGSTLEHIDSPLNEQGGPATVGDGSGGGEYYVVWRVMRGFNFVCSGVTAIGVNQMAIEMQVIWWERPEDKPDPLDPTVSWNTLQASHAHRVVLTTLRQPTL